MERTFLSNSENMTKEVAAQLAEYLKPGDVITLSGNLGAGKTTFTKGLATGLDISRPVTSPTFTIIKEYKGHMPLYHIDAYRLEDSEDDIGIEEYIDGDGVTVIEWAVFIEAFLPKDKLCITMDYDNDTTRMITIKAIGEHYESVLSAMNLPKGTAK